MLTAITTVVAVVVGVTNNRYGYFGDELYFISAGKRLDWGYADQPPLLPLLARLMDELAPGQLWWSRFPSLVLALAGIWLAALIARELGGGKQAQWVTGVVFALSAVGNAHWLFTTPVDVPLWTAITLFLVRWVRTRQDANLFWAGVITAISVQAKLLIPGFWLMLGISVLLLGPRDMLRRPALWLGAAVALLSLLPGLLWQNSHGWPQVEMGAQIAKEQDYIGGAYTVLPLAIVTAGLITGSVLLVYGVVRLLRAPELRDYRFLGLTMVLLTGFIMVVGGRPYYVEGLFAVCVAAGAVQLEQGGGSRWWRWAAGRYALAASLVFTLATAPPWESRYDVAHASNEVVEALNALRLSEMGWPEVTDSVASVYNGLPPEIRKDTTILGDSYWAAAAMEKYGPERGLPAIYSPSRGFWYFGVPPESAKHVLWTAEPTDKLRESFQQATDKGQMRAEYSIYKDSHVWLFENRKVSWSTLWPKLRALG
ncbi:glycosyl transferase, family 39 [Pseudonocardiaceae bacterium YIM PH 21723]|nr:glycosyl transferase, family 39 [Pseudonocardiaceae bacterium YIM PH 21723]